MTKSKADPLRFVENWRPHQSIKYAWRADYDERWVQRGVKAMRRLALRHKTFRVTDFWAEMKNDLPCGDLRIVGQVYRAAAKAGYISPTDTAHRVTLRGATYWRPIWESNIYRGSSSRTS